MVHFQSHYRWIKWGSVGGEALRRICRGRSNQKRVSLVSLERSFLSFLQDLNERLLRPTYGETFFPVHVVRKGLNFVFTLVKRSTHPYFSTKILVSWNCNFLNVSRVPNIEHRCSFFLCLAVLQLWRLAAKFHHPLIML